MIKEIKIKNYKSVYDTSLQLGGFNVMIGENGCGKSNLLEAIALMGAAASDKLDNEFFANRGIRVTSPDFMVSAFTNENDGVINLSVESAEEHKAEFAIKVVPDTDTLKWIDIIKADPCNVLIEKDDKKIIPLEEFIRNLKEQSEISDDVMDALLLRIKLSFIERDFGDELKSFIIYSPEESVLRRYDSIPSFGVLGRRGEGLFSYLKKMSKTDKGQSLLLEISENLHLLDWFDNLEMPNAQLTREFHMLLSDKYLSDELRKFDQQSTNEGFLFLLFYLTLFISEDTPKFFAIDNIGAYFNPKLCQKVTQTLSDLAMKYDKQVILTTHNPSVLDGLDITNTMGRERLFVIRRDIDGHTRASQVNLKGPLTCSLSSAWLKGMIGGIPDNF